MNHLFRAVSLIEGLSLLFLLCVAVPVRYWLGNHDIVWYAGWTHGLLFLTYLAMTPLAAHHNRWSVGYWLMSMLYGVMPFGFLLLERRLRKAAMAPAAQAA